MQMFSLSPIQRTPEAESRWVDESAAFEPEPDDFDTADSAELAPELDLYRIMAEGDDDRFTEEWVEWDAYICERQLWLQLEQSCFEGVLLPTDQRAVRLATCPERMLRPLRWFFECCPPYVKHHLALRYSLLVRLERARRTGRPDWRPSEGPRP
jgi:hypothetical protein